MCVVDMMKEGIILILCNVKIDMYKGLMRLVVDKWGCVEVIEFVSFKVKEDINMFFIEYEFVNVVE